jgi:recombination protein RecR
MTHHSSGHLENAIQAISQLPGIGRKSALRIALYLLKHKASTLPSLLEGVRGIQQIQHCKTCHNLSDSEHCAICNDNSRHRHLICVVESERDVIAIEETGQYHGMYHILGGVISPIEGIGPGDLQIASLMQRIVQLETPEIIMAISPTIEGETTIFYLTKLLKSHPVKVSVIARGVAFGGELEYADGLTLGRSIMARTPIELAENS